MTDDPRVKIAVAWCFNLVPALRFLAEIDAVDPLRRPVNQDRVEAAQNAGHKAFLSDPGRLGDAVTAAINAALAAADRVQAPAIKTRLDQELQSRFWKLLDDAKALCESDKPEQWAALYIAVAAIPESQRPDRVQAPAEKPDFPPWSREMARLLEQTIDCVIDILRRRNIDDRHKMADALNDAAWPALVVPRLPGDL